jgi:hypothetical protein
MRTRIRSLLRVAALTMAVSGLGIAPASAATTGALMPGVQWSGDLANGSLSQWAYTEGCPGAVSVVGSPAPAGGHAVAITVNNNDTETACPGKVFSANPAASLISPTLFHSGHDAYAGFSTYFPTNFPTIPHWFQFAELYGPPFVGSPPIGIDVEGNRMGLWRDSTNNYDNPWSVPLQRGAWLDIVLHVKFSSDPTVGFIEIWLNGAQQSFSNGQTRLYMTTLQPGINWNGTTGGNFLDLDQYRSIVDPLGPLTIYHAAAAIGNSYAAVAPNLRAGIATTTTTISATPSASAKPALTASSNRAPSHKATIRRRAKARSAAQAKAASRTSRSHRRRRHPRRHAQR